MTQNCDDGKAENHNVIFRGVARFSRQNGWFLLKENRVRFCAGVTRFLDKVVVTWVVLNNRGTIFSGVTRF